MMRNRRKADVEPDDSVLLNEIAGGSHRAFSMLYDRHAAFALGIAWKICRDKAMAEDIVQEAFLSIWRRADLYNENKGSVSSYLFGAVHHKAIDAIRHEESLKRRQEAAADFSEESTGEEVVEAAWASLRRNKVRQALQQLSPVQREALELAYLGGLTYQEVADKLGIPLGTAKTRMRDAMIRLRGVLSADEMGHSE